MLVSVHGDDDAGAVRGFACSWCVRRRRECSDVATGAWFGRKHGAGPGRTYGGAGPVKLRRRVRPPGLGATDSQSGRRTTRPGTQPLTVLDTVKLPRRK